MCWSGAIFFFFLRRLTLTEEGEEAVQYFRVTGWEIEIAGTEFTSLLANKQRTKQLDKIKGDAKRNLRRWK